MRATKQREARPLLRARRRSHDPQDARLVSGRPVANSAGCEPGGSQPPAQAQGPPVGGCPPAGGWTLRSITEPGAAVLADINGDGWLCGKDVEIPAFPGLDNYVDNVI